MTIKEIREKYKLTQEELSKITGIPKRTIGNWETGSRKPASYIPDLIVSKIEMRIKEGGNVMAEFDLGLAKCRAKERAEGAMAEYASYGRIHKVNIFDTTTEIGKNHEELWNMSVKIGKCTTESEINKYLERIAELRAVIAPNDEVMSENNMAGFDLGLAICRAKELAQGTHSDYVYYCREHNIDILDDSNPFVQNMSELFNMGKVIGKCKTEDDINKIKERIAELRAAITPKDE